ncbi:lipoyl protein ligase domain-containing protein [Natrialba aegyptia]|uniref:BPL/LPL catalytic domain-containing protein n=1 Tax=Natrialba aegyptia DSM 13077 TaxID=1227491 RepID=M0AIL0_9EURY|nr:lipoate--protein ligase family protein [Natrialba aegyptia]ELY98389.1 hypothetical protein C480_21554 [Natrialba aegyptia DSM 13077]
MRVLRGRASTIERDHAVTQSLLSEPIETAVRVWRPLRHVAFGPRDVREDRYERACETARKLGYGTYERSVGGRAVAYTGTTICFAHIDTVADQRAGLTGRYERILDRLRIALDAVDVAAERGEPEAAFCPGTHSLSAGGKLVGIAQRVRQNAALTAGIVVPRDRDELIAVLEPIYAELDIPFDPDAMGSIRQAGSEASPERVRQAIEDALVTGSERDATQIQRERVPVGI